MCFSIFRTFVADFSARSFFFFRKTTRPFNRVAFSLALSARSFPFCCSPDVSVPPAFLRFVPPSAVLRSHPVSSALLSPPPTPSSPFYSLGELYPVNRGTLLVTVCNLTEDQTKHDLTQPPPFCPPYPISSYSPTPNYHMRSRKTYTWETAPRVSI